MAAERCRHSRKSIAITTVDEIVVEEESQRIILKDLVIHSGHNITPGDQNANACYSP